MASNKFANTLSGLDSDNLDELARAVRSAQEERRRKFDMNSIKPGMSAEDLRAASQEISRALRELQGLDG